ncbi:MAG: glycosyltransferase [Vicinamibacterales bacterium]
MIDCVGVSFVVPVHNGRRALPRVLAAIESQRDGRPFEIIMVDDGSSDGSGRWLAEQAAGGRLRVVPGPRRGAAAAVNSGIREARYPIICQVDQDVILEPGWMKELLAVLEDPDVAAAQGHYLAGPDAGFWGRLTGRDLEWRYARMQPPFTDHVCTGNSAYRSNALHSVGCLDESLGYGYDNDLSYRLTASGYRLAFCPDARSIHLWREGIGGYLRQQFGVGYGRLDLVWKHPWRAGGDTVSDAVMMAHAPVMLAALGCICASGAAPLMRLSSAVPLATALALLSMLAAERTVAGLRAWKRCGDPIALAFPLAHLVRDVAWAGAISMWCLRRATGRSSLPAHSMARRADTSPLSVDVSHLTSGQMLAVVPAYNEVENLNRVVGELRRLAPAIDVLVVNDGSTDATSEVLPQLGVRWLTMAARVGVGGAVRAGLRYALKNGYSYVVRIDGDGQHRTTDIRRLLEPVVADRLDVVIGSRFLARRKRRFTVLRGAQALLAVCLTFATKRRITDPTSGFCLFGPRALRMLAHHHPTGYAEPELLLLLHRNGLRAGEVPIRIRPRLNGRTSLTPLRALVAVGRTLVALFVAPSRRAVMNAGETT